MRILHVVPLLVLGIGLISCNRDDPSARQAGREAYRASQDVKRGAREAGKDLRNASKQFREGWEEAKHQDPPRKPKRPEPPERDQR
ncbi:MAG TPA: hypothetical protein VGH38_35605 [Bryobacteraceae bacterium]